MPRLDRQPLALDSVVDGGVLTLLEVEELVVQRGDLRLGGRDGLRGGRPAGGPPP